MDTPALSRPVDFEWSSTIGKLGEALALAQGEIENAAADSENPHYGSNYADLASIIRAIRGPLAKAKIARHQALLSQGAEVGVRTSLIHSGEWIASTVWCRFEGTPQKLGSVVTYLRRYSLAAAVGLAQEDDDANDAEASAKGKRGKPAAAAAPAVKLDPKVQARIKILQGELAIADEEWREKLNQYYRVRSSSELTPAQAEELIGRLETRKSAAAAHGASAPPKSS